MLSMLDVYVLINKRIFSQLCVSVLASQLEYINNLSSRIMWSVVLKAAEIKL